MHMYVAGYNPARREVTYVEGLNVFAVAEDDIDELVNGDILTDQDLGIENFYFQNVQRIAESISIPSSMPICSSPKVMFSFCQRRTYCSREGYGRPFFPSRW